MYKYDRKRILFVVLPYLALELILFTNPFTNSYFSLDGNFVSTRGYGLYIAYLVSFIYILNSAFVLIKYWTYVNKIKIFAVSSPPLGGIRDIRETLEKIKQTASEEDPHPSGQLNLRTILGGDLLTTEVVRSQIWLFVLIVAFSIVYVAFRYQCQQDMIAIDKLEQRLTDAKYKALSSSSTLTEKCRESHVLEILKQNQDSLLHQADQPPYIIEVPE